MSLEFQSWVQYFGASAHVPSPYDTLSLIPVSAISVVAGARNHRNRLASPSWWRSSDRRTCPSLSQKPPTSFNRWEFGGNRRENLAGNWESDRIPPKPGTSWDYSAGISVPCKPPPRARGRSKSQELRLLRDIPRKTGTWTELRIARHEGTNLRRRRKPPTQMEGPQSPKAWSSPDLGDIHGACNTRWGGGVPPTRTPCVRLTPSSRLEAPVQGAVECVVERSRARHW